MKDVFSLVTVTAALCLVAFLVTLQPERGAMEPELAPSTTAALRAPDHGNSCRLGRPLLADGRGLADVLSRLRDV
jgi:hypothetical protein